MDTSSRGADSSERRGTALEAALQQIEKSFGTGAIMRMADSGIVSVAGIPTGALSLDMALGGVGVPRGRVCELFGPEGSGKTTLALHIVAEAQKENGVAAFIDAEPAMDPTWARKLGVNLEELLISQPDTGEQALEICEALIRSNAIDVIVVDSVAALVPRAEIEGDMGDSLPGLQARLMSQALRKLTAAVSRSRTALIFINQLREKIGIVFGNPEVTPGGRALKFYCSVRIDLRRVETLKHSGTVIGNRVRAKVVKNKLAPPFRTAEFDIIFHGPQIGISREGDILDLAVDAEIVKKQGSFYSFEERKLGQGREQAKAYLRENPQLVEELQNLVRAVHAPPEPVAAVAADQVHAAK